MNKMIAAFYALVKISLHRIINAQPWQAKGKLQHEHGISPLIAFARSSRIKTIPDVYLSYLLSLFCTVIKMDVEHLKPHKTM